MFLFVWTNSWMHIVELVIRKMCVLIFEVDMELVVDENLFWLKSEPIKCAKNSKWFFSLDLKSTKVVTVTSKAG